MMPTDQGGDNRRGNTMSAFTDAQLDELLGAYALNAVDDDERESVECYLARSPRARAEVADHLMVAAALGSTPAEAPLPLWDRISDRLVDRPIEVHTITAQTTTAQAISGSTAAETTAASPLENTPSPASPSDKRVVVPFESRKSRTSSPRVLGWLAGAAAAAVAVGVLGVQSSRQSDRNTQLASEVAALDAANDNVKAEAAKAKAEAVSAKTELATAKTELATAKTEVTKAQAIAENSLNVERLIALSDTKVADLELDGVKLARVVIGADGTGFLVSDKRFGLAKGEVLQLWGVHNDQVISLGVMPDGVTSMPLSAAGDWSQFVLTAEQKGGVVASDGPALAAGTFSA